MYAWQTDLRGYFNANRGLPYTRANIITAFVITNDLPRINDIRPNIRSVEFVPASGMAVMYIGSDQNGLYLTVAEPNGKL